MMLHCESLQGVMSNLLKFVHCSFTALTHGLIFREKMYAKRDLLKLLFTAAAVSGPEVKLVTISESRLYKHID